MRRCRRLVAALRGLQLWWLRLLQTMVVGLVWRGGRRVGGAGDGLGYGVLSNGRGPWAAAGYAGAAAAPKSQVRSLDKQRQQKKLADQLLETEAGLVRLRRKLKELEETGKKKPGKGV
jgi:hypothetical protein